MVAQPGTPAKEAAAKCPGGSRKGKQQRGSKEKGDEAPQWEKVSGTSQLETHMLLARYTGHEHQDLASKSTSARRAHD